MEIIVCVVLTSLTLAGMTSLFLGVRMLVAHRRYQMAGGQLGKFFLDPLQMDVRQDTWGNNCLSSLVNCTGNQTIGGATYSPTYVSTALAGNLTRVQLTINWTEPTR